MQGFSNDPRINGEDEPDADTHKQKIAAKTKTGFPQKTASERKGEEWNLQNQFPGMRTGQRGTNKKTCRYPDERNIGAA